MRELACRASERRHVFVTALALGLGLPASLFFSGCGCDAVAKSPAIIVVAPLGLSTPATACVGRTCASLKRTTKAQSIALPIDKRTTEALVTVTMPAASASGRRLERRVELREDKSLCDPVPRAVVRLDNGRLRQDFDSSI